MMHLPRLHRNQAKSQFGQSTKPTLLELDTDGFCQEHGISAEREQELRAQYARLNVLEGRPIPLKKRMRTYKCDHCGRAKMYIRGQNAEERLMSQYNPAQWGKRKKDKCFCKECTAGVFYAD